MAAFLNDTKCAPQALGNVLVLGLGVSGKAVARYCASLLGTRVTGLFVAAGARNADSEAFVASLPGCAEGAAEAVSWAFGDDALDGVGQSFDVCVASPGIPFHHELYQAALACSAEVVSEIEFSWRESSANSTWVVITGTNGKTTTTACTAHVLQQAGLAARAVGNIGDVCLEAVAAGKTQVYVCEASSYQLYSTRLLAPDVAVMLNITPDHLHWHETLEAYRDAKFKLLDNLRFACGGEGNVKALPWERRDEGRKRPEHPSEAATQRGSSGSEDCLSPSMSIDGRVPQLLDPSKERELRPDARGVSALGLAVPVAILDATNDVVRAKVRELKALSPEERGFDYIPLGTKAGLGGDMRAACDAENAAFVDSDGVLTVARAGVVHRLGGKDDLLIKGEHNVGNALAAAAVAVALGVPDDVIAHGLATFAPLEHRIEPCGSVAGVVCYNDSKATNVDATLKALASFPGQDVVVLLGGDDKDTDLAQLVQSAHEHVSAVVLYGAGRQRFAQAFAQASAQAPDSFIVVEASHMQDALEAALDVARPGGVVLLSPACASFDEFTSFEQRGHVFKQLVAQHARSKGA